MTPTSRFHTALAYASMLHQDDVRKMSGIPYVTHLLGVCVTVLSNGGTETEAIAALLHDAAEDQGGLPQLERIGQLFGRDVAEIVRACSDSLADTTKGEPKAPWMERKTGYHAHLRGETDGSVLLVAAADKLDNLRAIVRDHDIHGDALWRRFAGGKPGTLWNFRVLVDILDDKSRHEPRLRAIVAEAGALLTHLPQVDAPAGAGVVD
jgi:(p)ppGpp synthase/HD superfamily hydrolase